MAVLRLHRAAEETGTGESTIAVEPGCMSTELAEGGGAPNVSLRQLPAPETIATSDLAAKLAAADAATSNIQQLLGVAASDLAAKLAAADAAISNVQQLLGEVRISHEELCRALGDLKRDRDEWRGRAERSRPWWRRMVG
jgi:ABC-type transporter Mla subunit MlaD